MIHVGWGLFLLKTFFHNLRYGLLSRQSFGIKNHLSSYCLFIAVFLEKSLMIRLLFLYFLIYHILL